MFVFIMMQAYANAFESAVLDRLMMWVQVTLFVQILIGILFCTEVGAGDMQSPLIFLWFTAVFSCLFGVVKHLLSDMIRFRTHQSLVSHAENHDCPINVVMFVQATLNKWADGAQTTEWDLMNAFVTSLKKYPIPAHLADPILLITKGAPELLDLVLFAPDSVQDRAAVCMSYNDTSGDGTIDKGEWIAGGGNVEIFDYFDVDGDGELSNEKLEAMQNLQMSIDNVRDKERGKPMTLQLCEEAAKRYKDKALSNRVEADTATIDPNIGAVFSFYYSSFTQNREKRREEAALLAKEVTEAVDAGAAAKLVDQKVIQAEISGDKEAVAEAQAEATAARAIANVEQAEADALTQFPSDMIPEVFKQNQWGKVFWFLAHCSVKERYVAIQCLISLVTGETWSYKKVDAVLNRRGHHFSLDQLSKMQNELLDTPGKVEEISDETSESSTGEDAKMLQVRTPKQDPGVYKTNSFREDTEAPKLPERDENQNRTNTIREQNQKRIRRVRVTKSSSESEEDLCESELRIRVGTSPTIAADHESPLKGRIVPEASNEGQGLLGPNADLYRRYFDRYDVDESGTINCVEELEMLTINLLTAGRFPPIPHEEMCSIISRAQNELEASLHVYSRSCTLKRFVSWFEASFIHKKYAPLMPTYDQDTEDI